ncbi:MAG: pyridoxal phosphate-dependent aminotransferase [Pseudomonadota bacterium]
MTGPRLTPLVQSLPATVPFVGPEAQERSSGRRFVARVGANESLFGPSPKVIEAIRDAATGAWKYGDPENFELKQMLAGYLEIAPDCVVVGEGIDGLLGYVARMFVTQSDHVVTSDGAYPTFNYHVNGYGGTLHKVPYRDDREDPEALLAKAEEVGAKLIYLSNPDNPMGSWHDAETIQSMIDRVPEGTLLVLDEAYAEFAPEGTLPRIDPDTSSVIRMRTFSKGYGLAGMRVGYAIGHPDLIKAFDKVRNHFGMCRLSQWAALAALNDQEYLQQVVGQVSASRLRIAQIAQSHDLTPVPSATNFVTLDCGADAVFAKALLDTLIARGIFVRMPFAEPGNRCIRVTCGPEAEMEAFAKALPAALQAAKDHISA